MLLEWNTWLVFVRILNWVCIFHSSKCFFVSTLRQPTSAEKCRLSFLLSDLKNPKKQNVLNLLQTSAACHADIRSSGGACTPTGLLQTTTAEVLLQFCWENTRGQCLKIKSWELWLQEALQSLFPMTLFLTLTHSRRECLHFRPQLHVGAVCSLSLHRKQSDPSVSLTLMQTFNSGCAPNKTVNYIWFA